MRNDLYPILFKPLCRYRDWGSTRLQAYFDIPNAKEPSAELFQMIDGEDGSSVVENGVLAGKTLRDISKMGADFMGRRRVTNGFPICIKIFATGKPLALQVHPCDEALRQFKDLHTNAKAWYIIETQNAAKIHAELKPEYTQQQLLSRIGTEDLYQLVYSLEISSGDTCYLPSGRVHGVDAGCVILSIEQNDPTTFVVSPNGSSEYPDAIALDNIEQAKACINFKDRSLPRNVSDETRDESRNRKIPLVTTNPAFSLEEVRVVSKMHHRASGDSYHIIIAVDKPLEVSCTGMAVYLKPCQACLIPAKLGFYSTVPIEGSAKFIRVS